MYHIIIIGIKLNDTQLTVIPKNTIFWGNSALLVLNF